MLRGLQAPAGGVEWHLGLVRAEGSPSRLRAAEEAAGWKGREGVHPPTVSQQDLRGLKGTFFCC